MCKTTTARPLRCITNFFSLVILLTGLSHTHIAKAQTAELTIGGMVVDESLVTVKNNKLVFNGLSNEQQDLGFSIVGITRGATAGNVQLIGDFQIEYQPSFNICDKSDVFSYLISDGAIESVKEVSVEILCESLAIMSSMSPNGDGKQDSFVILGIDDYPNNELVIFNDLGLEIFRQKNYTNDWDGSFQGKPLPNGVYYYVFKPGNKEVLSGYLYMEEEIYR